MDNPAQLYDLLCRIKTGYNLVSDACQLQDDYETYIAKLKTIQERAAAIHNLKDTSILPESEFVTGSEGTTSVF